MWASDASSSPDESPDPIREECLDREVPEEPGEVGDQVDCGEPARKPFPCGEPARKPFPCGEPARKPFPCDEEACAEGESLHRGEDVDGVGDPAIKPEPHV